MTKGTHRCSARGKVPSVGERRERDLQRSCKGGLEGSIEAGVKRGTRGAKDKGKGGWNEYSNTFRV